MEILRSQNATSSWGCIRTLTFAFKEQGERLIMLNKIAIQQMKILTSDPGEKRLEG